MSSNTHRHSLAFVLPSQAQKHVTLNESLRKLDAIVQCAVLSTTAGVQPPSPREGDSWILPEGRTGADWGNISAGHIASFQDGLFVEIKPTPGFLAFVIDVRRFVLFDGTAWLPVPLSTANISTLGINTSGDAVNRLAVKADSELLSHDDVTPGSGNARKVINKASAARTASLLFQTAFSGRAEIGLIGDDKLAVKVSSDGSNFTELIRADASTGNVSIRRASAARTLHLGGPAPCVRTQRDGADGYGELFTPSSGQTILSHVSAPGEGATIDLTPMPGDSNGSAAFRFFRGTNTTHGCYLTIFAGDNTTTYNHQLSGKWDSYIQASSGNVRIGSTAAPVCKLDVAGAVRVGSYTVSALPSAAAGAGQLIYVSNAAGGAVLAFSDGANWRRSDDRAVVS